MRLAGKLRPSTLRDLLKSSSPLSETYRPRLSINLNRYVDRQECPIPCDTYPATECLQGLDFTTARVLEYGSGASSLWRAGLAGSVLSVEHDATWFAKAKENQLPNLTIKLAESENKYVAAGVAADAPYHVVIIDGVHRHRCAQSLKSIMADECFVVLDNSDWHPLAAKLLLEDLDLLQVDFHGFGPINHYAWTISVPLTRNFKVTPSQGRLPIYSTGAIRQVAEGQ